jgi:hypothetical protein
MSKKLFFLLLSMSVLVTVGMKAVVGRKALRHTPYTITWRVTTIDGAGKLLDEYTETRYVSASGNWHTVKQFADGSVEEGFAEVGRGVFALQPKQQKMYFLSEYEVASVSPTGLQQSAQYQHTEKLLGYKVYVSAMTKAADSSMEIYRAPDLNGDMLKYVMHDGASVRTLEPVKITLSEPTAAELKHEEFPVDNHVYAQTHGGAAN